MADTGCGRVVHRIAQRHQARIRGLQIDHRTAVVQLQVTLESAQRIADRRRALHQHGQQPQAGEVEALGDQQAEVGAARGPCGGMQQLRGGMERQARFGVGKGRRRDAAGGQQRRRVDAGVEQQAGHGQQRTDARSAGAAAAGRRRGLGFEQSLRRYRSGHVGAAARVVGAKQRLSGNVNHRQGGGFRIAPVCSVKAVHVAARTAHRLAAGQALVEPD